jgi:hypothetical protein
VHTYVVPNSYTLAAIDPNLWASDGTTGDPNTNALQNWAGLTVERIRRGRNLYPGHGTGVASIAGGATLGVASKAELYLVKIENAYRYPGGGALPSEYNGRYVSVSPNRLSLDQALRYIYRDVVDNGKAGRAVINFSYGKYISS